MQDIPANIYKGVSGMQFDPSEFMFATANSPQFIRTISHAILPPVLDNVLPDVSARIAISINHAVAPLMEAIQNLTALITKQASDIADTKAENIELKFKMAEQATEIAELRASNTALQSDTGKLIAKCMQLDNDLEEQEQYSRRNCLRFHHPITTTDDDGNEVSTPPPTTHEIIIDISKLMLLHRISADPTTLVNLRMVGLKS